MPAVPPHLSPANDAGPPDTTQHATLAGVEMGMLIAVAVVQELKRELTAGRPREATVLGSLEQALLERIPRAKAAVLASLRRRREG